MLTAKDRVQNVAGDKQRRGVSEEEKECSQEAFRCLRFLPRQTKISGAGLPTHFEPHAFQPFSPNYHSVLTILLNSVFMMRYPVLLLCFSKILVVLSHGFGPWMCWFRSMMVFLSNPWFANPKHDWCDLL
jgi:hypothetical protein